MSEKLTLKQIEARLRLKIEQARLNGFDVVPWFSEYKYPAGGAIDLAMQRCCLYGAASDLAATKSAGGDVTVPWLPSDVERGFETGTQSFVFSDEEKLGYKLRVECLAYMEAKRY